MHINVRPYVWLIADCQTWVSMYFSYAIMLGLNFMNNTADMGMEMSH